MSADTHPRLQQEESATFDRAAIDYVQRAAATGLYEIRGLGAKRRVPHFDDLLFLGASLSRYPLEGYRERCSTRTVLGSRHATKPVELAVRAMQHSSRADENVLDLFGGSGSTLIAAEQTGRRCFMMELDPLYADVIVQRFEKFSGQKAERRTSENA